MDRNEAAHEANRIQDDVQAKHVGQVETAIARAMKAVAADLPTGGRPEPPPEHFREINDAMRAMYRDITREMASSLVGQFKSGFAWLETKQDEEDFYERVFEEFMSNYGAARVAQITETTRRQIVRIIERGLKDGLSIREIADNLTESIPEIALTRSVVIARTETHSAAMFASLQSAKRSTVPLNKEWVSVEDSRTRDFGEGDGVVDTFNHRVMDEVRVPLDEPFQVPNRFGGYERLMYPGDPVGSAANLINCRCSQVYVSADETEQEPS